MIYEISCYYGIDPKKTEKTWDVYDYYEHLVFKIQKKKTEEYFYHLSKNKNNF